MEELIFKLMTVGFVRLQGDILSIISWEPVEVIKELIPKGYVVAVVHHLMNGTKQYDIKYSEYIQDEGRAGTVECQICGSVRHQSNDCPRMWEL